MDIKQWLHDAINHGKQNGDIHVSIPISVVEKIVKHIEAGAAETGEQLENAIGEAMFDR